MFFQGQIALTSVFGFSEILVNLRRFPRAAVGMGIPMGIPMGMGMGWVWER